MMRMRWALRPHGKCIMCSSPDGRAAGQRLVDWAWKSAAQSTSRQPWSVVRDERYASGKPAAACTSRHEPHLVARSTTSRGVD